MLSLSLREVYKPKPKNAKQLCAKQLISKSCLSDKLFKPSPHKATRQGKTIIKSHVSVFSSRCTQLHLQLMNLMNTDINTSFL